MSVTPPAERAGAPHPGPASPVIVLSPPRSFSTVVSMMLGQHPQLFGLPETQLFVAETVKGWWDASATATFPMTHGLLRAVAELVFGGQTEENAVRAAGWLSRRWPMTTGLILESLADRVAPRRLVEKSPSTVFYAEWMQRANRMFPDANFIHLTRHPRGHAESVMKYIRASTSNGSTPGWLLELASDQSGLEMSALLDPQRSWLRLHNNIVLFLSGVPADRQRRIRGEDAHQPLPAGCWARSARWLDSATTKPPSRTCSTPSARRSRASALRALSTATTSRSCRTRACGGRPERRCPLTVRCRGAKTALLSFPRSENWPESLGTNKVANIRQWLRPRTAVPGAPMVFCPPDRGGSSPDVRFMASWQPPPRPPSPVRAVRVCGEDVIGALTPIGF